MPKLLAAALPWGYDTVKQARYCLNQRTRDRAARTAKVRARRNTRQEVQQQLLELAQDSQEGGSVASRPHFRIVLTTQMWENYGSRWKAKGGSEYHHMVGDTQQVLALGQTGLQKLVARLSNRIAIRGSLAQLHSYDEYVISWDLVPTDQMTEAERMYWEHYQDGYYDCDPVRALAKYRYDCQQLWL